MRFEPERRCPFLALHNLTVWEISENQPANKQTLGRCANVNYDGENNVGGSVGEIREHKHRRK
ncbi:hypothetical protein AKJ39_03340 [candidate division MSBL1 archaeon SCGC-AAA259J03]|uniref:Uncharacterized protein n=1 Tax=candidate division MSBL1 archaeon SCGC-AAA259J03 TaxID=1698269 RepID=A0A656YVN1_9EURY|nr:hypothetical protein AKJ39_03340 [candidate division MSBL1 archaeon SCGC-AAA259J03]